MWSCQDGLKWGLVPGIKNVSQKQNLFFFWMRKEVLVTWGTNEDLKGILNKAVTIVNQLRATYSRIFFSVGEEMSSICKNIVSYGCSWAKKIYHSPFWVTVKKLQVFLDKAFNLGIVRMTENGFAN